MYYRGANAFLLVYDVTDKQSFEHIQAWREEIDLTCPQNVLKVLVGNKGDLTENKQVETEVAAEFAERYMMTFIETSAIADINIEAVFSALVEELLDPPPSKPGQTSPEPLPAPAPPENPLNPLPPQPSSGGCCF
jgi:GTPase SAR1 family protein